MEIKTAVKDLINEAINLTGRTSGRYAGFSSVWTIYD